MANIIEQNSIQRSRQLLSRFAFLLFLFLYHTLIPEAVCLSEDSSVRAKNPFVPRTYVIHNGPEAAFQLQERLIDSIPGDIIQLEAGKYRFDSQLDITCDNLTIRGRGPNKTILSFQGQDVGSEGLIATGNAFLIEDLAVEDSVGNAIKVLGANGVIFRRVRTEWTNGPDADNGAYGIYPVQCKNVLIEDCTAIAASDAGIYVGQSEDVIVRNCRAEWNVAGIEIENTLRADVYDNVATNNTGGILVFDLPGLQLTNGGHVRIFNNRIFKNNTKNFAHAGNMVAAVPQGSGLMIMATDHVEVFDNEIADNQTSAISIVSFLITERPIKDPAYDPYPEGIWIHDNQILRGGNQPAGKFGALLAPVIGLPFPQIFFDGIINVRKLVNGKMPDELSIKFSNNGEVTFANGNVAQLTPENVLLGKYHVDRDQKNYKGRLNSLSTVKLSDFPAPPVNGNPAVEVYRQTPQMLSEWNLFAGDPRDQQPAEGIFRYDLNTPLFSDGTAKYRFIRLPTAGAMVFEPTAVMKFPVGTAIVKTFAMPHDQRSPESGQQLLETRIEEHRDNGWYGYSYIWNEEQSDARLALGGGRREVKWLDDSGKTVSNQYQIPNANQCITCHGQEGKFQPLGPTARNLNRLLLHSSENQLAEWQARGWLKECPDIESLPALPVFDDPSTGSIEQRTRAWLDVNCAHCHNPVGSARTSGLDLSLFQNTPAKYGVWKSPVATGRGSGGRKFDIVPGKPDESILVYRIESNEPGVRMPNLARNLSHAESIELIRAWIESIPDNSSVDQD